MKNICVVLITFICSSLFCCNSDKALNPAFGKGSCGKGKVLKVADNRSGRVHYDSTQKSYIISYSVPGTYDSQDLGIACNLPENMQKAGAKVLFSGAYRFCDKKAPIAGQTYYYLELSKIAVQ